MSCEFSKIKLSQLYRNFFTERLPLVGCRAVIAPPLKQSQLQTALSVVSSSIFKYLFLTISQTMDIATMCKEELATREFQVDIQYIVTSRQWSYPLEDFVVSNLKQPVAMLSTGLEILAYANISPSVKAITPDTRCSTAMEIVKSSEGAQKMVVCCSTCSEADLLHASLCKFFPSVLLASSSVDQQTLSCNNLPSFVYWILVFLVSGARKKWQDSAKSVLIMSDDAFAGMAIADATALVHYSLPDTKYKFNFRLACIMENIPNKFKNVEVCFKS